MRLKQVEIYGFKSFAQRTEVRFDKGITGIVGPNGSGKSNIADAVRWVLGEQSAKMLRGARMEDVIFSGTQSRKALPYCEVSLLFDNEDQSLNSPFSQVLVTRRVYRSGEGEYYLNKTACRLKDILELFRDTGIGKEGYSIIGQGRIEEILSTKGEERRLVFEEAAGIVTFRVRKEEAERKLNKTVENLNRVSDILEELESRLEPLKQQAETAQEYLALAETLRRQELNVFLVRSDKLRERMSSLKALMESLQEGLQTHEQQLETLAREKESIEAQLEGLAQEDEAARQAQAEAQEQQAQAQAELAGQQSRLDALRQELANLLSQNEKRALKQRQLEALFATGGDEAQAQQALSEQAQAQLQAQESAFQSLQHQAEAAEQALNAHKQRIVSALNTLSDTRSQQARQQAMLQQMTARLDDLAKQESMLSEAVEQDQCTLTQAEATLEATQTTLNLIQAEVGALSEQANAAREELSAHQAQTQALMRDAQVSDNRRQLLEEMARDYEGYNQAVKRALQFTGEDPRVHGVVAKLIRVPQAYETAIDMILGGTLQHIVTDDEETAKRLIDHLRSNKLGRTTFLPITSIRPRTLTQEERRLLSSEGCLGVASELISYDVRYQGIVENILGRTVIVRDLDAAIPLSRKARQAFNVVTLAGDVMRAGGAMTGGTAQGRGTSLLGREREILWLREELLRLEAALVAAQEQDNILRQRSQELTAQLKDSQEGLAQQQIALARDQERLGNAQTAREASAQRLQAVREAQAQLSASMEEINLDLQGISVEAQSAAVDQEAMEQQTLTLQQAMQASRKAAEAQREALAAAQAKQSELNHQADILRRDRQRWEKEMQELRQEADRAAARQGHASTQIEQAEQALSRLQDVSAQRHDALKASQQHSQQTAARRGQTQAALKRCGDARDQLHSLHQQDSDKLHRNELVYARTENELQSLSEYIMTSYELTYSGAESYRMEGKFDLPQAEVEIKAIKARIRDMGSVHVGAVEEYAQTKERYDQMTLQRNDALKARDDLHKLIDQLLSSMEKQFVQEFAKLNTFFGVTFARLFGGGQAELILSDPSAPLTCDIDVAAQPPGKKLQLLSLLSGGERALTAIAILFAMLKLKPTPFCVLDEIEAALDEANITYFADYLSEYAQSTQFIVITHRKGTMERCDALYGVAMEEKGVSSMVSVDLERFH